LLRVFGQEAFEQKVKEYAALRDILLLEAETLYGEGMPSELEEEELLRHLEENCVTKLLSEAMDALARAERDKKNDEAQTLLQRCKELTQRLATLKSARFGR
jgi:hypothetical protein